MIFSKYSEEKKRNVKMLLYSGHVTLRVGKQGCQIAAYYTFYFGQWRFINWKCSSFFSIEISLHFAEKCQMSYSKFIYKRVKI